MPRELDNLLAAMTRPAFIAELLEAAGKAGEGAYMPVETDEISALASYIEELEAENKALKEALRPFEQKGRFSLPDETRVEIVACDSNRQNWFMDAVKLGDLRRAAALGEKP